MRSRACRPPAIGRAAAPASPAVQQSLPLAAPAAPLQHPVPRLARRLWFCVWLPQLALEANRGADGAMAVVEERHGIHRVLLADTEARAAGVQAGQSANAALALLPGLQIELRSESREQQAVEGVAAWLERFSSFVCMAEHDVLLLEVAGSLRLFGGLRALRQKVVAGLQQLGFDAALAIAPTPLAATWLARAGRRVCIRNEDNLATALRDLPLRCLRWPVGLTETLQGTGVATVGDCLRLPREGFARRFGAERLLALDRALGRLPDPRSSWRAPEHFCADHEMTEEQTDRDMLLAICHELLEAHERFLLARQLGTQRVSFSFYHLQGTATELRLGCARAERTVSRWFELLGIRFDKLVLPAPVIAVRLRSGTTQPLQAESGSLGFHGRPERRQGGFSITQLAERLVARIGEQSVQTTTLVAEHRPQYAWQAQGLLADWAGNTLAEAGQVLRRPLWMLPEPARLGADGAYPLYEGCRLQLIDGPERLETGWWDEDGISRDYYTALNPAGMRLWVFRNRQRSASSWYLHGYFG